MKDIVVDRITVTFGENTVLSDFYLIIPAGQTSCIMGQSGCGKTTLGNVLLGLIPPDKGSVRGIPENVAAVFQENRLCDNFSALANLRAVSKTADEEKLKARPGTFRRTAEKGRNSPGPLHGCGLYRS